MFAFSDFLAFIAPHIKWQMKVNFAAVDYLWTALKFGKRKKLVVMPVFMSFKQRRIRKFHVEVLWRAKKYSKKDVARPKCIVSLIKLLIKLISFFDALGAVDVIVAKAPRMNRCV